MSDDPQRPWEKRPPHLQRWVDDRSGIERVYLRIPGRPKVALKGGWGTQALAIEALELIAAAPTPPKATIGTLAAAVRAYRGDYARRIAASAEYTMLSTATKGRYDRWLDKFEAQFEQVLLQDVDAAFVLDVRNAVAKYGHEAANTALQVLKNVCKPHVITEAIPRNPFELIDKVARPQGLGIRNPRWEDEEFEAALAVAESTQPGLARALALGRWGGFRRQTICSVPLRARIERTNAYGALERRLLWLTEKKEVLCDRREDPRLTDLLTRTPSRALTIAYNADGAPWKPRALNQALDRLLDKLAGESKVRGTPDERGRLRSILTIHGLRHARGVEIALAGGSDAEIMAGLDHATPRAAQGYRKQADRLKLADAMQDRVDAEVVRLRTARERRKQGGET